MEIRLMAEVLHGGKGCPVCGRSKTSKARTCRDCYNEIGPEATAAVDAVVAAAEKAREGHKKALAGGVRRGIVFGPVLAQVKINADAKMADGSGVGNYLHMGKNVEGGFLNLSVFGASAENIGKIITGLVELKTREVRGRAIPYVRIQKVEGVVSDAKLSIRKIEEAGGMDVCLPCETVKADLSLGYGEDRALRCAIGFVPAEKERAAV